MRVREGRPEQSEALSISREHTKNHAAVSVNRSWVSYFVSVVWLAMVGMIVGEHLL